MSVWVRCGAATDRGQCVLNAGHLGVHQFPPFPEPMGLSYEELARLRATAVDEACAGGPFDPTYSPSEDAAPPRTKIPVWLTPLQACELAAVDPGGEVSGEALAAVRAWLEGVS